MGIVRQQVSLQRSSIRDEAWDGWFIPLITCYIFEVPRPLVGTFTFWRGDCL